MSNYNKFPETVLQGLDAHAFAGYDAIVSELKEKFQGKILVVDAYPGVRTEELLKNLVQPIDPDLIVFSDELFVSGETITERVQPNLTDDRVFGFMSKYRFSQFVDAKKKADLLAKIEATQGLVVVYGVGASELVEGDLLVYADLSRWEIQQRYRSKEIGNWKVENYDEDVLKKYKRGFFFEWRMADYHKKNLYGQVDYYLDTNLKEEPKMITAEAFNQGMEKTVDGPFRVVPFFDPGVWGGQWMKEVCDLDRSQANYAWCFDCVPEENSLFFRVGDVRFETPSINLVFMEPQKLLGEAVHARFGTEFPIRFDFLDTFDGQNLSLQVHPLTEYIQETFGMHYTQDESYYILDAGEDAVVYLGVKEGINPAEMIQDLKLAQKGELIFPDEKYINQFPAKKHDHFLIPAGTVHCSGKDVMVLEISATPYIFTFKLWDWSRLGLDGLPRPVHLEHGQKVIQFDRDTKWVSKNLVSPVEIISDQDGVLEEKTGLHEREFIETRRFTSESVMMLETKGSVNVLNLVDGKEAIVESPDAAFDPFVVHYAETFIVPEHVKTYTIRPYGESAGQAVKVVQAYVRN